MDKQASLHLPLQKQQIDKSLNVNAKKAIFSTWDKKVKEEQ